jgi:hypothetical protein
MKERNDFNIKQSELYNNTMNPVPQGVDEAEFLRQQQMGKQQPFDQQNYLEPTNKWSDSPIDESLFQWYPYEEKQNQFPNPNQLDMGDWKPQDEFPSSSSPSASLRPDFPDPMMNEEWSRLPSEQQKEIINLPLDEQITIMKQIISNKSFQQQQQQNFPNYGDVELHSFFTMLPKEEQIELLKLSHERQIEKLKQMSIDFDNAKVQTIVPKTAAEELYEGKLGLLAPVSEKKTDSNKETGENEKNEKNDLDNGSSSETKGGSIKKIIF